MCSELIASEDHIFRGHVHIFKIHLADNEWNTHATLYRPCCLCRKNSFCKINISRSFHVDLKVEYCIMSLSHKNGIWQPFYIPIFKILNWQQMTTREGKGLVALTVAPQLSILLKLKQSCVGYPSLLSLKSFSLLWKEQKSNQSVPNVSNAIVLFWIELI